MAGLLLGACGGGDDDDAVTGSSTTVLAGPGDTSSGAPSDPTADPAGGTTPSGEEPATGPSPSTAPPGATVPPDGPIAVTGGPGSFARTVLAPGPSVTIELHVADGAAPGRSVVDHLVRTLAAVSANAVGVASAADPGGATDWTTDSIEAVADRGTASTGAAAVLHLLFVHGTYEGDDGVLGIAVRGDVAAVFVDRAAAAAGLLGATDDVLASVATHELGHLLGLVDLVLTTRRGDPGHPGHSSNPDSVMYWAVESDLITSLLGNRPPRDFDADDLADLHTLATGG